MAISSAAPLSVRNSLFITIDRRANGYEPFHKLQYPGIAKSRRRKILLDSWPKSLKNKIHSLAPLKGRDTLGFDLTLAYGTAIAF